jgi:hypothetical protein
MLAGKYWKDFQSCFKNNFLFKKFQNSKFIMQSGPCESKLLMVKYNSARTESTAPPSNLFLPAFVHSDYRTVSPYWVLPVYVELIRAVWADDGDRPLLFWRNENLVQNQLFALTKLNIYKTNCLKISATTPAAVQKKGTLNKKSMKLWFVKTLINMHFLKCLKSSMLNIYQKIFFKDLKLHFSCKMYNGSTILLCVTIFFILKQCLIRVHCSIVTVHLYIRTTRV